MGWPVIRAALPVLCLAHFALAEPAPAPRSQGVRGYLGVTLTEICPDVRAQTSLKDGEGLMIGRVAPDSPAAALGLVQFDILTKFNNQWLISPAQFITLVENAGPGAEVEITYLRRGTATTAKVTLGNFPAQVPVNATAPPLPEEMLTNVIRLLRNNPTDLETVHRLLHSARGGLDRIGVSLKHGSRISLRDENGEVELTQVDHAQQVRAWDKAGKLIFEGPCNTPADQEAMPAELKPRVERLLKECRNPKERQPALPAPTQPADTLASPEEE